MDTKSEALNSQGVRALIRVSKMNTSVLRSLVLDVIELRKKANIEGPHLTASMGIAEISEALAQDFDAHHQ